LLFDQADGFVRRSPGMAERFRVFPGYRRIDAHRTGGRVQVYAADERTGDGVLPDLALIDELHRHRDLRLYRTWRGKLSKRGGQLVAISTAGEPGSDFETVRGQVRVSAPEREVDGAHTRAAHPGRMVLHDWRVADGAHEDLAAVKAANPFSGITLDTLEAKRDSPTMTVAHWRRFVCNQATREVGAAVGDAEWQAAGGHEGIPEGERVWLGIDLGFKWDTTALVPLWVPDDEPAVLGDPEVIVPPRDGTSLAPSVIEQRLLDLHERTPIDTVVMDEWASQGLVEFIEAELGARVIAHPQSNVPMSRAFERFMEGLRSGDLRHTDHPDLTAHVLNAVAKPLPGGRHRFDRPASSRAAGQQDTRVIDALVAAAIVYSQSLEERNAAPAFNLADYHMGVL
jgi:phage terminase large subunit-like protein